MSDIISQLLPHVHRQPPVSEQALEELIKQVNLPHDYISILRLSNGMEGEVKEYREIRLWKAESLIEENKGYNIEKYTPGFFLIGSDKGDISYGLDIRPTSTSRGYYLARPFISVDWDEVAILGATFREFIEAIKQGQDFVF